MEGFTAISYPLPLAKVVLDPTLLSGCRQGREGTTDKQ